MSANSNQTQGLLMIEPMLFDCKALMMLTSLSLRTIRRLDSNGDIPGRVRVGRRILFDAGIIREWIKLAMPDRQTWRSFGKTREPNHET